MFRILNISTPATISALNRVPYNCCTEFALYFILFVFRVCRSFSKWSSVSFFLFFVNVLQKFFRSLKLFAFLRSIHFNSNLFQIKIWNLQLTSCISYSFYSCQHIDKCICFKYSHSFCFFFLLLYNAESMKWFCECELRKFLHTKKKEKITRQNKNICAN